MPIEATLILETLTGVARAFAHDHAVADVMQDLTPCVTSALTVAGAGVSLTENGRLSSVAADSAVVTDLERIEEKCQEGPSVEAARTGKVVPVSDLSDMSEFWPDYVAHARKLNIVGVAGIPLRNTEVVGALSVYSRSRRSWSADDLAVATVFADLAGSYVTSAWTLDFHRRTSEQLRGALASRVIIEQAKGIIAASRGICVDKAFRLLRKHANDHNATLQATADAVVNLGLRP